MRTFCLSAVKGQQKGPVFTSSRFLRGALVAPYHLIWEGSASLDPVPRVPIGVLAFINPPSRRGRQAATEKLGKVSWIDPSPRSKRSGNQLALFKMRRNPAKQAAGDSKQPARSSYRNVFSVLDPSAALDWLGKGWGTHRQATFFLFLFFFFGQRAREDRS